MIVVLVLLVVLAVGGIGAVLYGAVVEWIAPRDPDGDDGREWWR